MTSKYWKTSLPCIAVGCTLLFTSGRASAQTGNETMTTTTKIQGAPKVLNSYMVPTLLQTRETTTADGDTIKETAPIIQERHEQVLLPQEETTTSTTLEKRPVVIEESEQIRHATATRTAKKPTWARHKHVAYRAKKRLASSTMEYTRTKRVEQRPSVAHTEQTVIDKSMIIERRDPALDDQ